MARYHTAEEIRRYDLMKLGVLLLLILLLLLTWVATRDQSGLLSDAGDEPAATSVAEGSETENPVAIPPETTLGIPSVNLPAEPLQPGSVTLSGTAEPGAQVVILVNGAPAAAATAGVDGNWSATLDLPAGTYTVQARTMDNVGGVAAESEAVAITVGGETSPAGPIAISPPGFDALTGAYVFTGTAAPGQTIHVVSGGTVVGTTTADETGNFSIEVPAAAISGEVQLQTTDETGVVVQQSEPLKLNSRPPSLTPSTDMLVDLDSGALVLPSRPEGLTLSGQGEPGTQVELLVDGVRNALAVVDVGGTWSMPLALPDGAHTFQFNTLDPGGNLLSSAIPVTVVVGAPPTEATAAPTEDGNQTIAEVMAGRPEFSSLLSVLQSTGSLDILAQPGPFTTFAPTNEAFANLPQRVIDGLNANPQILSQLLQYHITHGRYPSADLQTVQPATVNGRLLTVGLLDGVTTVNDALVTAADIPATNGIIHAIDRILVPPLVEGVRPPVIDASGVATFTGSFLTIVGTAEPGRTILVELNGEPFGEAVVGPDTTWAVSGNVTPGEYQIVAYMLGAADALEAVSRPVMLQVNAQ